MTQNNKIAQKEKHTPTNTLPRKKTYPILQPETEGDKVTPKNKDLIPDLIPDTILFCATVAYVNITHISTTEALIAAIFAIPCLLLINHVEEALFRRNHNTTIPKVTPVTPIPPPPPKPNIHLKPCPFCGGQPFPVTDTENPKAWIACTNCGATTEIKDNVNVAITNWNNRKN